MCKNVVNFTKRGLKSFLADGFSLKIPRLAKNTSSGKGPGLEARSIKTYTNNFPLWGNSKHSYELIEIYFFETKKGL